MKKLLLTSVISFSAVFAATDAEILGLYDQEAMKAHGLSIEIADRKALDDKTGFEMVTLKVKQGDMSQEDIVFVKDDILVPDIVSLKTKDSYKAKYQAEALAGKISAVYSKEDSKNIIKLGNDPKKPTMLMLTDADCPYCRMEMKNIEESLKTSNFEIIMTSIHGPKSHAKSAKIYEEVAKAKDDAAKIAIFKKYYAEDLPEVTGVDQKEIDRLQKLADSYFEAGVKGVPFIMDVKELKK